MTGATVWGAVARTFRKAARVVLPGRGRHRGQPSRRVYRDAGPAVDEQWILDLLPPTPPAPPAEPAEAWAPRITRWVRLACPQPDDTIIMGIQPWAY